MDFVGDANCSSHWDVVKPKPCIDEVAVQKSGMRGEYSRESERKAKKQETHERKEAVIHKDNWGRKCLINTFQWYYEKALQKNKDLQNMQKAVKAIWYHYASTEVNQMHDYCPKGTNSQYKWQRIKPMEPSPSN